MDRMVSPDQKNKIPSAYELNEFEGGCSAESIEPPIYATYQSPFMRSGTSGRSTAPVETAANILNENEMSRNLGDDNSSFHQPITANMATKDLNINRYSFGFEKLNVYAKLVRWRFSDVVLCILLFVLFVVSWFHQVKPFQRQFFINDLTISHPFAEVERVPIGSLFFFSFIFPTIVITVISLLFTPFHNKHYVLFVSLLGLYVSIFTNSIVTEMLKVWIGRHRPDFLARCIVKEGTPIDTMVFAKDVCTTTNSAVLLDGFKTTPSGHSSISFSGLGYLSLWLCGQFLVSHIDTGAWRTILSASPAFGASYVAFSRTEDYRHHFVDVILGSILGSLIAWWSYRRIFPSVTDEFCYLPYQLIEEEKEKTGGLSPYNLGSPNGYELAGQRIDAEAI